MKTYFISVQYFIGEDDYSASCSFDSPNYINGSNYQETMSQAMAIFQEKHDSPITNYKIVSLSLLNR